MQTNNNITLFNPFIEDHDTIYYGCQIRNVWAIARERIDLDINAEFNLSRVIVRVPLECAKFSKTYIEPIEYPHSNPDVNFTFIPGSIVVLGIVDEDTATKGDLVKKYNALQITKVHDNRYGAIKANWHWKLEGV